MGDATRRPRGSRCGRKVAREAAAKHYQVVPNLVTSEPYTR